MTSNIAPTTTTAASIYSDSRLDAAHALLDVRIVNNGNGALDALAALASNAHCLDENHPSPDRQENAMEVDVENENMPPPPSMTYRRLRAVSNPEGMEKWEAASSHLSYGRARAFSSDLGAFPEEEPLEAEEINEEYAPRGGMSVTLSLIRALEERKSTDRNVSSSIVVSSDEDTISSVNHFSASTKSGNRCRSRASSISTRTSSVGNVEETDIVRRARCRLLEDMIEVSQKNGSPSLNFPHSFAKYKNIYNQDGRIGIYTPEERSAIIARFHDKRLRRVWNKKIRYNCRKDLADRRLRVKGRFVKRDSEEAKAYLAALAAGNQDIPSSCPSSREGSPTLSSMVNDMGPPPPVRMDGMPDVNDPEAGFCPTKEAPYRRARRHTIT